MRLGAAHASGDPIPVENGRLRPLGGERGMARVTVAPSRECRWTSALQMMTKGRARVLK